MEFALGEYYVLTRGVAPVSGPPLAAGTVLRVAQVDADEDAWFIWAGAARQYLFWEEDLAHVKHVAIPDLHDRDAVEAWLAHP